MRLSNRAGVSMEPTNDRSDLSIDEAAPAVGVSTQFLLSETEVGRLRCHEIAGQLRIRREDLHDYEVALRARREEALQRMADDAREQGLDY